MTENKLGYERKIINLNARITELERQLAEAREALKPFAGAFEKARDSYSKRYQDRELGYRNLDKMPDDWPMERLTFNMGTFRRAARALSGKGET